MKIKLSEMKKLMFDEDISYGWEADEEENPYDLGDEEVEGKDYYWKKSGPFTSVKVYINKIDDIKGTDKLTALHFLKRLKKKFSSKTEKRNILMEGPITDVIDDVLDKIFQSRDQKEIDRLLARLQVDLRQVYEDYYM